MCVVAETDTCKLFGDCTAQKMTFSIKDLFSKCDRIRRKLRIWSHLLKKSLMKNFIFCAVKKFLTLPQVTLNFLENILKSKSLPTLLRIFGSIILTISFKIFRSSHPEVFCKKRVAKSFSKFTEKHLCWSFFFNKVTCFKTATLLKERLQHKCFPVNFAKLLTVVFFT